MWRVRTEKFFKWEFSIKCLVKKWDILVRNGFNWLRIRFNDMFIWTYWFHNRREIYSIDKLLFVSQGLHEKMKSIFFQVFIRRISAVTTFMVTFSGKMPCVLSLTVIRTMLLCYMASASYGNCSLRWIGNYTTVCGTVTSLWSRDGTRNYRAAVSDFNFLTLPPCNTLPSQHFPQLHPCCNPLVSAVNIFN